MKLSPLTQRRKSILSSRNKGPAASAARAIVNGKTLPAAVPAKFGPSLSIALPIPATAPSNAKMGVPQGRTPIYKAGSMQVPRGGKPPKPF